MKGLPQKGSLFLYFVVMIPAPIHQQLQEKHNVHIKNYFSVSGGCINACFRVNTANDSYFLKWNDVKRYPGMFETEAKGLRKLAQLSSFTIPEVVFIGEIEGKSWLLMEFIERGVPSKDYWTQLGEKLANMHQTTNSLFGLDHDNYIGSLPQSNVQTSNWCEFFTAQRITPQLKLAIDSNKLEKSILPKFKKLFALLPNLFPNEPPALLHGDLWTGNIQPSTNGDPCIFDPAVYFGHREMELSFTQLFGGFDQQFYNAYKTVFPIAPKFQDRIPIYNLYPLLVHVNLFGGGYVNQVLHVIRAFS